MSGLSPSRMAAVKGVGRKAAARERDDFYPTPRSAPRSSMSSGS